MDTLTYITSLPVLPEVDFAEFGETEVQKVTRIQKLTGQYLARNWLNIPHVTHHDQIDVTDAEIRRSEWNQRNPESKVTPVALLVRALTIVLPKFPYFNASLSSDGSEIVIKKYYNIGVAVETPSGLVVPVICDADKLSLVEIGNQIVKFATKARDRGLSISEMSGSSISLSSLGHIGGTAFSPIINSPDVAILGASAIVEMPRKNTDNSFAWKKMLPLSLSYDHRVINGSDAARFLVEMGKVFADNELLSRQYLRI